MAAPFSNISNLFIWNLNEMIGFVCFDVFVLFRFSGVFAVRADHFEFVGQCAEVYVNFNEKEHRLELREKDEGYRSQVIKFLTAK